MNVYRFRSMNNLLCEHKELENQTIYFASPDQLNDPMEGFRDIVWSGDKIVWTNFFKHYIYCLHVIPESILPVNPLEFDARNIPITGRWDQLPTSRKASFNSIWRRFLKLPQIPKIIVALSNTTRRIRQQEMEKYLRVIRAAYMIIYLESLSREPLLTGSTLQQGARQFIDEMSEGAEEMLRAMPTWIAQSDKSETEKDSNAALREFEDELREAEETVDFQMNMNRVENLTPTGELGMYYQPMLLDFPKMYLREIERLLWPKWYVACFMKDYHNSSVWGHYGDGHKGVCLIFETEIADGLHNLSLYEVKMTDKGEKRSIITKRPFREVRYSVKPGEIDFFRSIGRLTGGELKKLWYTDDEGNESECGDHLQSDGATFDWQESYWDRFYRDITTKTKDWEYEKEYRLILEDMLGEYDEGESRTITYVFRSLKGIIFGIKTSDEDKLRIMEIILRRCRETDREDFEYYQAYYSPEDGNIHKYKLELLQLDGSDRSDKQAN